MIAFMHSKSQIPRVWNHGQNRKTGVNPLDLPGVAVRNSEA